jgi:hypothetical protein
MFAVTSSANVGWPSSRGSAVDVTYRALQCIFPTMVARVIFFWHSTRTWTAARKPFLTYAVDPEFPRIPKGDQSTCRMQCPVGSRCDVGAAEAAAIWVVHEGGQLSLVNPEANVPQRSHRVGRGQSSQQNYSRETNQPNFEGRPRSSVMRSMPPVASSRRTAVVARIPCRQFTAHPAIHHRRDRPGSFLWTIATATAHCPAVF